MMEKTGTIRTNATKEKVRRPQKLQKFMHPENPYKNPPSFKNLALKFPEFRQYCTYDAMGKVHLDFKNRDAVVMLSKCLLKEDFSLDVNIPSDTLVPTLPLRFNYLLWLRDLMSLIHPLKNIELMHIVGYDIGTGASCIYPLLGVTRFEWEFLASDIDETSIAIAKSNVNKNNLNDSIYLQHIDKGDSFFQLINEEPIKKFLEDRKKMEDTSLETRLEHCAFFENRDKRDKTLKYLIDFTMCNPPFFSCEEELDSNSKSKRDRPQPNNAQSGKISEKMTEGGEVAFIEKMIRESRDFKHIIRVFSTLIGKKEDVNLVKQLLIKYQVVHFKFTEFCQGRTMRWGVAWTFDSHSNLQHNMSVKDKASIKPQVLPIPRKALTPYTVVNGWKLVEGLLKELKIKPSLLSHGSYFIGADIKAYKATWTNQRKKRREELRKLKELERCARKRPAEEDLDTSLETSSKRSCTSPVGSIDLSSSPEGPTLLPENSAPMEPGPSTPAQPKILPCVLRCQIHVTHKENAVRIEVFPNSHDSSSKEACNQFAQYLKNKLSAIQE